MVPLKSEGVCDPLHETKTCRLEVRSASRDRSLEHIARSEGGFGPRPQESHEVDGELGQPPDYARCEVVTTPEEKEPGKGKGKGR